MTVRRLHDRAREHTRAAVKKDDTSALGDHYRDEHPRARPQISYQILDRCNDELRLRIKEAMAIQRLRPTLNRRDEDMGTGFLM